jgi:hypothetical protein
MPMLHQHVQPLPSEQSAPDKFPFVRALGPANLKCGIFTGVNCHIARADVKSEEPQSLEGVLQKGMEIQARVKYIDFSNGGRLQLVSKSSELADQARWEEEYIKQHDRYYHVITAAERQEIERNKRVRIPHACHACLCA